MILLIIIILSFDRLNPINENNYTINYYLYAFQLFCQLILPCLLGCVIAQVSAVWIKADGLSALKKHKHTIYVVIECMAAYMLFMLYPIFTILFHMEMPNVIMNYMLFAMNHIYLYIIIYFLLTLSILKICKN